MKEFDYTKWDNMPREMWVWHNDENRKAKKRVVYIRENDMYPVLVKDGTSYKHCAEIEPARRMSNYELAHWLWEGIQKGEFREYTYIGEHKKRICITRHDYFDEEKEKKVDNKIKIRVNGGEWKEPLIEE